MGTETEIKDPDLKNVVQCNHRYHMKEEHKMDSHLLHQNMGIDEIKPNFMNANQMEQHHQLSSMEENINDIAILQQLLQNSVPQELQESTDVDVVQILEIIEIIIELIIENIVIVLGRQNQNMVVSIHIVKMN